MSARREGLALRELSAQLEAPKSSLLPLLRTLTARGYLEQGTLGEYRLGPKALELGMGSAGPSRVAEIARPALRELMERTGETVFLGDLGGGRHRGGLRGQGRERAGHPLRRAGWATGGRCTPPRAAR